MVAERHNLSRRAVLGASVGAPVLLIRDIGSAGDLRQPWERALAAFRHAEARLSCFLAHEARLSTRTRAWPGCEAFEEGFNDLECLRIDALKRLLRVPAPNLRSLSLKVDMTVDEEVATLTGAKRCLVMLKADARRLAYGG